MDYFIIYLLIANFVSALVFALDKLLAKRGARRVREKTLILLALAGGCFGSLLSMRLFRHKTLHKKFSIGLPLICLAWTAILVWHYIIK